MKFNNKGIISSNIAVFLDVKLFIFRIVNDLVRVKIFFCFDSFRILGVVWYLLFKIFIFRVKCFMF